MGMTAAANFLVYEFFISWLSSYFFFFWKCLKLALSRPRSLTKGFAKMRSLLLIPAVDSLVLAVVEGSCTRAAI